MMCRIHQSGRLDALSDEAGKQVADALRIYKDVVRKSIPEAVPLYPVGASDVTNREAPIALGMRSPQQTLVAVWRIDGPATARVPLTSRAPKLVYPTDLGIRVAAGDGAVNVEFPRPHMACLISV